MKLVVSWQERLRSAVGAGLGIGVTGLSGWWLSGQLAEGLPWLMAPMGASALLVFTISASPLDLEVLIEEAVSLKAASTATASTENV